MFHLIFFFDKKKNKFYDREKYSDENQILVNY